MNRRAVGNAYEAQAAEYLTAQGYRILERNFRCRTGEIDLIARDGAYLVFVEVKYRKGVAGGDPLEAVDARKQAKISRTASYYLLRKGYGETTPCRFDVVAVRGGEIQLLRDAFAYVGYQ